MLKKTDIVLIVFLFLFSGIFTYVVWFPQKYTNSMVVFYIDGKIYKKVSLLENTSVLIDDDSILNEISISNSKVTMLKSNCKDELCIHQGSIATVGQSIICLPNHVVVTIEGDDVYELDAIIR